MMEANITEKISVRGVDKFVVTKIVYFFAIQNFEAK